jgi:hypothetical protein
MAAVAKQRNIVNGSITTGGSANAQTFTTTMSYLTVPTGMVIRAKVGFTNTGSATLNLDAIAAVTIKNQRGDNLAPGELLAGTYATFLYNGTNWILLDGNCGVSPWVLLNKQTVSGSSGITYTGLTTDYIRYHVTWTGFLPTVSGGVSLVLRASGNNGVSYDSGSNYQYTYLTNYFGLSGSWGNAVSPAVWIICSNSMDNGNVNTPGSGEIDLYGWGGSQNPYVQAQNTNHNAGQGFFLMQFYVTGIYAGGTGNAIQLLPSGGTLNGTFSFYGVR